MILQKSLASAFGTTGHRRDSVRKSLQSLPAATHVYRAAGNAARKTPRLESVEKITSAMDVSLSQLFDKLGESGNDSIASKCYDLVASKTEAEQAQLYKMLLEMDKYRNQ